jgi:ABC-2 type transport system permease protein
MKGVWLIFVKELKSYFGSPVAYIVLTGFSLLAGWIFYQWLELFIRLTTYSQGYMVGGEVIREWTLTEDLMTPLYKNLSLLFIIMVPAITMRLFAEEKKLKTEELLATSPIHTSQVLLGKYLAAVVLLCVILIPVGVFPLLVLTYGEQVDTGPIILGYLGLFMIGFSLSSMGIFASSLTENQIVAFIFCAVLEMFFFTIGLAAGTVGTVKIFSIAVDMTRVVSGLSLYEHFDTLTMGIARISDIFYFVSLTIFFLFVTRYSAESSRL